MKIAVFTSVHRWNDSRIFYKEVMSLCKEFDVAYHASADFSFKQIGNVKIFGLPQWKRKIDRLKTLLIIFFRILRSDADYFHFHDPELLIFSFVIALKRKILIFDIHENIKFQLKSKEDLSKLLKLVLPPIYSFFEYFSLKFVKKAILAESSYLKYYKQKKPKVIFNYPILKPVQTNKIANGKIVYIGNWIEEERGAIKLIESCTILKKQKVNFVLNWVGDFHEGDSLKDRIFDLIDKNDLRGNINFLGRVDYNEIFAIISESNLGFSCLYPVNNFLESYPTKIFEYMMFNVPVICSNFPLWKEIVEVNDCGLTVDPLKPEEIAKAMTFLIENPERAKELGRNGRKAVEEKYNWAIEEKKLLDLYKEIL